MTPETHQGSTSLRQRVTRKVVRAASGGVIDQLTNRIDELEAEVQENRNLNVRVAELVDLLTELMLPLASQDRAAIEAALAKFERSVV
ncbi:MAG: hypothetical protein JWR52_1544 [Marmoricola sp.]|nr:hypothetical protein [Marmoricola sp.]